MNSYKITQSYANTLFSLCKENNCLNTVAKDFTLILDLIKNNELLDNFIKNPILDDSAKIEILNKIFNKLEDKNSLDFISFIAYKSRLSLISDIIKLFLELKTQTDNLLELCLISPFDIKKEDIVLIEQTLKKKKPSLKDYKFSFTQKKDDSLIGGVKIKINNYVYDLSLKTMFKQLII